MGSIKTTTLGILAILGALVNAAQALLAGQTPNWQATYQSIILGIGLLAAKDHKPLNLAGPGGILLVVLAALLVGALWGP